MTDRLGQEQEEEFHHRVRTLIQTHGPHLMDHDGNTLLTWASRYGLCSVVRMLIEQYRLSIDAQNDEGQTPLSVAVIGGHRAVVRLLIDCGANLNASNGRGESPLHHASALGWYEIARLIVEEGGHLEAEDECGDSPLHFAVREDRLEIVEFLLSVGACPDHLNQDEESPAELAQLVGSLSIKNAFVLHNSASDTKAILGNLDKSFITCPFLLQKSTKKSPLPSSLSLPHSHNAVWQGENSTSSFPKRLTPISNLPSGYHLGRQLINV